MQITKLDNPVMSVLLGDVETSYTSGKLVASTSRGILFATLSVDDVTNSSNGNTAIEPLIIHSSPRSQTQMDTVNLKSLGLRLTSANDFKFTVSIWVCARGLECMVKGSIFSRSLSVSSPETPTTEYKNTDVISQGYYNIVLKSDGQRLVILLRDELIFLDLLWYDKRLGKSLQMVEAFDIISSSSGLKSKIDSPYISEIISLKLNKSHRVSMPGLTCIFTSDNGKTLIATDSSAKLSRLGWDGMHLTKQRHIDPIRSPEAFVHLWEPVLFETWSTQVFEMLHKVSTESNLINLDEGIDYGHLIMSGIWSEQLRLICLIHADGSFSVVRLTHTGYLSSRHIFPAIRQHDNRLSHTQEHGSDNYRQVVGRVLSLTVVDSREYCQTNSTLLAVILRTNVLPSHNAKQSNKKFYEGLSLSNPKDTGDVKVSDNLLVFNLAVVPGKSAEIELKTISHCNLGYCSHSTENSFLRLSGLSIASRGPVVLVYHAGNHSITAHGLLLPTTSLFMVDLNGQSIPTNMFISGNRIIIASQSLSNGTSSSTSRITLFNSVIWKSSLKYNDDIYLDTSEDEWYLEVLKVSLNRGNSRGQYQTTTSASETHTASLTDHFSSRSDFLVRETCAVEMRSRIPLPTRLRIELCIHEKRLQVAETKLTTITDTYQSPGYIAAVAEAGNLTTIAFADDVVKTSQNMSLNLWMHNKYTKRWRGTNLDLDADSVAVLVDPSNSDSVEDTLSKKLCYMKSNDITKANMITALNGPFIHGVIAMTWFQNHSLILLTIRKSRCCLEVVSRETLPNQQSNSSFSRPSAHCVVPLPVGSLALMMKTVYYKPNSVRHPRGLTLNDGILVAVMDDVTVTFYHVVAYFKSSSGSSINQIIADYSIEILQDISLKDINGLSLPLRSIAPVNDDTTEISLIALDNNSKASLIRFKKPQQKGQSESAVDESNRSGEVLDQSIAEYRITSLCDDHFIDLQLEQITVDTNDTKNSSLTDITCGKSFNFIVLVAQQSGSMSSASKTAKSMIYIPMIHLLIPAPSLPKLSCYCGMQSSILLCIKESSRLSPLISSMEDEKFILSENNTEMIGRLSLGTVRAVIDEEYNQISESGRKDHFIAPLVLHEISLPIHIFIGIARHLGSLLISYQRRDKSNQMSNTSSIHSDIDNDLRKIESWIGCVQKLFVSLTLRRGRQSFVEDLEFYVMQLTKQPGFKNTIMEYRIICALLYHNAQSLLIQIITRIIRKLEIESAQKLFPIPISLNMLLTPLKKLQDPNYSPPVESIRSLTPFQLFQLCLWSEVQSLNDENINSHRFLICSARLLTFLCENEGGTETYRSTERSLALTLEVMNETSSGLSLRIAVHCLDFACRLEDALASFPMSNIAESMRANFDSDDYSVRALSNHGPYASCNERLWREGGVLSTLGIVSPSLTYLVGGGAMWMVGRTLGAVAAAVTTNEDQSLPNPSLQSSTTSVSTLSVSNDGKFRTFINCSRFLSATSAILSSSASTINSSEHGTSIHSLNSPEINSKGSYCVAFIALTCANFLKDQRYFAASIFAASMMTSELVIHRIRDLMTKEMLINAMNDSESTLSDDEYWMSIINGLRLGRNISTLPVSLNEFSMLTIRSLCMDEIISNSEDKALIYFDLPDNLIQTLTPSVNVRQFDNQMLSSRSSDIATPSAKSRRRRSNPLVISSNRHGVGLLPDVVLRGMTLALLITGRPRLSKKFATVVGDYDESNMILLDWVLGNISKESWH